MENKIDHRKNYILMVDTETANTLTDDKGKMDMSNVLVYDCGWAVIDKYGNVYETASYVNRDIFVYEREMMQSAYYGWKISQYVRDIRAGQRIMSDTHSIRRAMLDVISRYDIQIVAAHNARFDVNALNTTLRYVSKSKYRYWLPFGIEVWDTMKMARSVIHKMPMYRAFCEEHSLLTANGRLSTTAESLYKFISLNPDFKESHTGFEDVMIEAQILHYCFRQHKEMQKVLYARKEVSPLTPMQYAISIAVKKGVI